MDQESQKKAIDDQPRESEMTNVPNLCANNCGFFGSASTNNLCSKCYRDYLLKQPKVADSFVEKTKKGALVDDQASNENKQQEAQNQGAGQEEKAVQIDEGASSGSRIPANRCSSCRKKVGLTGFKCRCRQTFCSIHRYSDKHNCIFDYKSTAQNAIAKANPVVKPDKIDKI